MHHQIIRPPKTSEQMLSIIVHIMKDDTITLDQIGLTGRPAGAVCLQVAEGLRYY